MENYVSSMSNIRRMEDTQPEYKLIGLQPLVSSLYDSAKIICTKNGKELILQNDISVLQLSLDSAFISQVCNKMCIRDSPRSGAGGRPLDRGAQAGF